MLTVGFLTLVGDIVRADGVARRSLGWAGLLIDITLDLFLVGVGVVFLAVWRRRTEPAQSSRS